MSYSKILTNLKGFYQLKRLMNPVQLNPTGLPEDSSVVSNITLNGTIC